jgi:hypothetical protein
MNGRLRQVDLQSETKAARIDIAYWEEQQFVVALRAPEVGLEEERSDEQPVSEIERALRRSASRLLIRVWSGASMRRRL